MSAQTPFAVRRERARERERARACREWYYRAREAEINHDITNCSAGIMKFCLWTIVKVFDVESVAESREEALLLKRNLNAGSHCLEKVARTCGVIR